MRLSLLAALTFSLSAFASNVLELDSTNFENFVGEGKPPALVEFYAPWCGHCKNLAPVYEELADAFSYAKDKIQIIKVDADGAGKSLGGKFGVAGFPTLKYFPSSLTPEDYNGGRELNDLAEFITKKSGVKAKIKPPPPSSVIIADVDNFKSVVLDPKKNVLVTFTAPWCGHCKSLKPTYETVAKIFKPESETCILVNFDADAAMNKDIAKEYGVSSFPTIKFFPAGPNKEPIEYESARSEEGIISFLNEHCGTQRAVGGGLNYQAGRVASWDEWVGEFMNEVGDRAQEVRNVLVKEIGDAKGIAATWYLRALDKVASPGGEAWLEKEKLRLDKILQKRTLADAKLDEIKIKANILQAFVKRQGEVAGEAVQSVAAKIKSEL